MLRYSLIILFCLFSGASQAQYYTENWRQDVLEMIEDGRKDAAQALLEEAAERQKFISDPIERINHGRFLGDAFDKLKKPRRAREYFEKAMKAALELKPVWRSLSAVISVLELQAETEDRENSRALIQQSLDAKLLPRMAKDHYASEIGRYVKRFERATRAQIHQLLKQLRGIDEAAVRKKAFYKLTELEFAPFTGEGKYETGTLPLGMDDFERFLWFSVMAKYFAQSDQKPQFKRQVEGMQKAYDRFDEQRQQKYRKIYRMVTKLDYRKPKPIIKAEPEAPSEPDYPMLKSIEPVDSNMHDLYYGGED